MCFFLVDLLWNFFNFEAALVLFLGSGTLLVWFRKLTLRRIFKFWNELGNLWATLDALALRCVKLHILSFLSCECFSFGSNEDCSPRIFFDKDVIFSFRQIGDTTFFRFIGDEFLTARVVLEFPIDTFACSRLASDYFHLFAITSTFSRFHSPSPLYSPKLDAKAELCVLFLFSTFFAVSISAQEQNSSFPKHLNSSTPGQLLLKTSKRTFASVSN